MTETLQSLNCNIFHQDGVTKLQNYGNKTPKPLGQFPSITGTFVPVVIYCTVKICPAFSGQTFGSHVLCCDYYDSHAPDSAFYRITDDTLQSLTSYTYSCIMLTYTTAVTVVISCFTLH